MASITSVTASSTSVATGGGTSTITVLISDTPSQVTLPFNLDSSTGSVVLQLVEQVIASVNPTDAGKPRILFGGQVPGGTLTFQGVNADGLTYTFLFTAS